MDLVAGVLLADHDVRKTGFQQVRSCQFFFASLYSGKRLTCNNISLNGRVATSLFTFSLDNFYNTENISVLDHPETVKAFLFVAMSHSQPSSLFCQFYGVYCK